MGASLARSSTSIPIVFIKAREDAGWREGPDGWFGLIRFSVLTGSGGSVPSRGFDGRGAGIEIARELCGSHRHICGSTLSCGLFGLLLAISELQLGLSDFIVMAREVLELSPKMIVVGECGETAAFSGTLAPPL